MFCKCINHFKLFLLFTGTESLYSAESIIFVAVFKIFFFHVEEIIYLKNMHVVDTMDYT